MSRLVEALQDARFGRRTLFRVAETTAMVAAGLMLKGERAAAAETPNDLKNLTYIVHPTAWEVRIPHGNFWDFGMENADNGVRQLYFQISIDYINRGVFQGLEIPVIKPTPPLPEGQWVDLQEKIPSKEDAVRLYGVQGSRSASVEVWDINQFGQATLKPATDGTLTRINPNGAVINTWSDSKSGPRSLILHPGMAEFKIPSGTFWRFGTNSELGVRQIVRGEMEKGESPYVMYPIRGAWRQVGLERMFARKQELIDRFGIPGEWSSRFEAWDINREGGATLWPNPDGSLTRVRPNGAAIEIKGS